MDTAQLLGSLGDFVGAILIAVALIYLSVQVRQNTRALNTQSRQATLSCSTSELLAAVEHPDIHLAMLRGVNGLSPEENIKVNFWLTAAAEQRRALGLSACAPRLRTDSHGRARCSGHSITRMTWRTEPWTRSSARDLLEPIRGGLWLPEMRPFRWDTRFQSFATRLGFMDFWLQYGRPMIASCATES